MSLISLFLFFEKFYSSSSSLSLSRPENVFSFALYSFVCLASNGVPLSSPSDVTTVNVNHLLVFFWFSSFQYRFFSSLPHTPTHTQAGCYWWLFVLFWFCFFFLSDTRVPKPIKESFKKEMNSSCNHVDFRMICPNWLFTWRGCLEKVRKLSRLFSSACKWLVETLSVCLSDGVCVFEQLSFRKSVESESRFLQMLLFCRKIVSFLHCRPSPVVILFAPRPFEA